MGNVVNSIAMISPFSEIPNKNQLCLSNAHLSNIPLLLVCTSALLQTGTLIKPGTVRGNKDKTEPMPYAMGS